MKPLILCVLASVRLLGQSPDSVLHDRIFRAEQQFVNQLAKYSPIVETYIQEVAGGGPSEEIRPVRDHYYLGRAHYQPHLDYEPLIEKPGYVSKTQRPWNPLGSHPTPDGVQFLPKGFAQMAVLDRSQFDSEHYLLTLVRKEFLGEVRCLVLDVAPRLREPGRFVGRIWTDESDTRIVRFSGTYLPEPASKKNKSGLFLHFDSWRTSPSPGTWIPSHVYVEDAAQEQTTQFKALTKFWDFTRRASHLDQHTDIQIEGVRATSNLSDANTITPLEGQKAWEHQAEDNILSRLEQVGLLAPPGSVDEILNGVVENLIFGAKLRVHAQCRILLTTPFETFSIGNTIVISRGLLDVLPDETSLATVLADELAHIELGHRTPTQFAFYNQTMLSDADLLAKVRLVRTERELQEAGSKTLDILRSSPYQHSGSAGLFLKAVASRGAILPRFRTPNLGNQLANTKALNRLATLIDAAPALEESKVEQIAALPLGSRVKLNPWNNELTLIPPKPMKLLSAREKMPFEIAPYFEYLRLAPPDEPLH